MNRKNLDISIQAKKTVRVKAPIDGYERFTMLKNVVGDKVNIVEQEA